jgi:murein L,D-transpeptidase YcbB/YkuD
LVQSPLIRPGEFQAPIEERGVALDGTDVVGRVVDSRGDRGASSPTPGLICDVPGAEPLSSTAAWFVETYPDFWQLRERKAALIRNIQDLRYDGLTPKDYLIDQAETIESATSCSALTLSLAYVSALSDLLFGHVDPESEGLLWRYSKLGPDERQNRLKALLKASTGIVNKAFEDARPKSSQYLNLRVAYGDLLRNPMVSWPEVANGSTLSEGDRSPRVARIRERLEAEPWQTAGLDTDDSEVFDNRLTSAVRQLQKSRGIKVDGIVGPDTLRELNRSPQHLIATIRLNLERMRWTAAEQSQKGVLVDIAGQRLYFSHGINLTWSTRVQVGRSGRQTPALVSHFSHLTINPTWTVPPTILRKDKLPEIRSDPGYLAKHRIRVFDQVGSELNPSGIDWNKPGPITLRQDAGPESALGLVAFRFPNPFSVYLHDTPSKRLFDVEERFFSSGCVRVENAMSFAEVLITASGQENLARFREMLASGKTRNLSLGAPIPLVMVYWTVKADESGQLWFRPDLYNRDSKLLELLDS